jgi:Cu/Ag efflux pump CusA
VRDSAGALIPLDAVTQIRSGTGLSEIFRENGRFLSLVLCDIENRERTETLAEIQKRVSASLGDPPKGVMIEYR